MFQLHDVFKGSVALPLTAQHMERRKRVRSAAYVEWLKEESAELGKQIAELLAKKKQVDELWAEYSNNPIHD